LILFNSSALVIVTVFLWGWLTIPFWLLLVFAAISGVTQFTLYALAGSYANDLVTADRRVGLSAVLLMSYGIGACLGPLLAGGLMRMAGASTFYVFMTACSILLVMAAYLFQRAKSDVQRRI
jgi:MFS family permease